jgi:RNA polymerase sigma-70 factor (ECF subfamily)
MRERVGEADLAKADVERARHADADLVCSLRDRSPEACARLYDRFAPGVHRFAEARLAGDVEAAEDIVVETMVGVVRDIRRFDTRRSPLSAWVYGIARRRVQMEIRRRRRRKSVPGALQVSMETVREASDGSDLGAGAVRRLHARRQVEELRAHLSDVEFETLALSCVGGLSATEIGDVIGRSERAVHSILHRARTKARQRLVSEDD